MGIDAIGTLGSLAPPAVPGATGTHVAAGSVQSFGESLMRLVESAETAGADANGAVANMLDKSGDVHDAMIALQRAELSLQLTVQIRNKLVSAYQDIMRMPV